MESRILPATNIEIAHHAKLIELIMFRKIWASAIVNLQRERSALVVAAKQEQMDGDGSDGSIAARMVEIEYRIAIYEMCIDHANEREEILDSRPRPDREANRERFFRLMAAMAKSANDKSDDNESTHFVGSDAPDENAWSPERWGSELETAASSIRRQLVASPD